MRFFQTILSGAALIAAAAALTIDTFPSSVVAGQTYTITYSPKDNTPTTFILRQGPSGNLNTVETLTTTATGGSFSWTVKSTYADQSNYALQIQQGDVINYSGQFPLTGGSGSVSSAASSRASASASAASSASAAVSSAHTSSHASASIVPSAGTNSTVSSATLSRSTASGTSRPTGTSTGGSSGPPQSTGAASSLSSPLGAIFGAFAAFAYLA